MGDEDERTEFIRANVVVLSECTPVGPDLVRHLYQKKLINDDEMFLLSNSSTSPSSRAMMLYTTTAKKWSQGQFEEFKSVLRETGFSKALQVFSEAGADVFLTNEQVQLLREQRFKSESGCYEGLCVHDEVNANRVVEIVRGDNDRMFREDGRFELSCELDRKEVIPLVKTFAETLKNRVIWWNPRKPQLPEKYVERSVAKFAYFESDGTLPTKVQPRTLPEELRREKLVVVVDPPGMGKSSEMTHLEQTLRVGVTRNRIILRVNLNEVQTALKNLSPSDNVNSVLLKLAHPFLPHESLETPDVALFVLLDGLDEVCPTHKTKMITLLKILNSMEEDTRDIRVVVTTRPHLRKAVEREFNLRSVSLLPLTEEEQNEYAKKVLGVSSEQFGEIRGKLTSSVKELLKIPLMLNMFVDVIKSDGTFTNEGGGVVNIFELYRRFVDSKHKLHLVEKEKMGEDDNYTEMRLGGMLHRNLPQYYRVAINLLIEDYSTVELLMECGGSVVIAQDEPSGVTRDELLSVGLLVKGSEANELVFKHRSFGEFFYARLLTLEESLPQVVRDTLFGNIYEGYNALLNVEAFIVAAAAVTTALLAQVAPTSPSSSSSATRFTLSPTWILLENNFDSRCFILQKLVNRSKLFPLLAREVLASFIKGDNLDDLWEILRVLVHKNSEADFPKLFGWMSENVEWTREELLRLSGEKTNELPQPVAHLITAIALRFKDKCHRLLTEEEVGVAVNSCGSKLISIVAMVNTTEWGRSVVSKWDFVERHLPGGRSLLRNVFKQIDEEDLFAVIKDVETTWKLVSILTREEIWALVTNEETRVSDVIGERPWEVVVALGEEFLPPPKQFAEFRYKFCAKEEDEGKTVFEMDVRDFAVKYLWDELVGEAERDDRSGPVGVALREAVGRLEGWKSWDLLRKLEWEERVSERSGAAEEDKVTMKKTAVVMDWVAGGGLQWRDISDTTLSLEDLPLLLRYCGNLHPSHLTTFLQEKKRGLQFSCYLMFFLRSLLVILSPPPSSSLDSSPSSSLFSVLFSFLRENINRIHEHYRPLVELFLGATREEIQAAAAHPLLLLGEVCVGGVALNLLTHTQQPSLILEEKTWVVILSDVIENARCCDLPVLLLQLRQQTQDNQLKGLKEVITSEQVFDQWTRRFCSWNRRGWEESYEGMCGLRHLLTFYFSVFGSDNLEWMKKHDWMLVREIPVEISMVLQGEQMKEAYPDSSNNLVDMFTELVREEIGSEDITFVSEIGDSFRYQTEWEWEALINLLGGEAAPLQGETLPAGRVFYTPIAAPLMRVLIRMFGVKWTTTYLRTHKLWELIPSTVKYTSDTVESLGSLLHSAIELGELEEVKKRAWPGIASWRNGEGKNALEVSKETKLDVNDRRRIKLYLEDLVSINSNHPSLCQLLYF